MQFEFCTNYNVKLNIESNESKHYRPHESVNHAPHSRLTKHEDTKFKINNIWISRQFMRSLSIHNNQNTEFHRTSHVTRNFKLLNIANSMCRASRGIQHHKPTLSSVVEGYITHFHTGGQDSPFSIAVFILLLNVLQKVIEERQRKKGNHANISDHHTALAQFIPS